MKLKKILIATLTIVPTVALISASCGNTQNLDALKDFISKTKLSDILDGAEQVDSPKKAEDLEEGKKQVSNKAVDEFNKALDEAKKVNDESNAKQALDKLKKAIENLKNAIVVGKMKLVGDLGRLRNWLNDNTADKLLEGVEVVDVLSKPDPTTIPTGLKQIQKIEKDKFVEVWNKLDKITEEDKAKAGLTELSDAVKALKAAIVVGTKEMPLGWFDPKDEAISENILNKYFTVNKEGTLTKKSGTSLQNIKKEVARLIIPGTLNGKQIKKIGSYLFYETDKIKDVIFKEKIEETYSLVFGSSKVRRVVFLKNVDKTGNGIFDIANPAINHKFLEVAFSDDQEFTTYTEKDRSTFMNAKISKLVKLGKISQVPENFFFNAEIDELRLPETVTKIHVDGFKNAKIDKLIIKKDLYLANSAAFAKAHINQIEWIGGGAATPQLDKLLNLINDSTVDKILHKGRKAKILDSTSKPSADTLYKDWKVVLKSAVTTYEAALAEARAVKDESKADAAIAKLNLAIDAFKAEIVVGTKEFDGYFTDGELQTSIELLEKYLNVDGTTLSTNNENKYLKEENGKMHLSKLVIPNELGGREIDEVHQAILRDLTFVDDVVFTNKFDAIYYASFQKSKFKRVIFLDNINLLGQQTFDGCDIDEVIFAENQGDFSTKPGAEIHKIKWFKNAKIGKLVKLGKITTIGALVFDNAQIGELRLPETVTTIDKTAFQNATINKLIIKKSTYEANEAKILQANIATIEFIEGGSPVKKPNLKKLYTLLLSPEADVNEILRDVEVLDQPNKPNSSEVASGKKVVRKLAKEEYIAAYNEALAVNDESKADATIAKLQAAIQKLKDEIVTGVGSWKNQLKDLIYSAEINVILKEVEILSETIVTKPNPDEIEKGVKAILWSDKEAYKKVLDEAKLAQNDEVKAKDAFDKLKAAIQDLKTKFIIGTHEGPIIPADAPYTLQDLEKSIEIINTYLGVDSSNLMLVKAYGAKYLKDYKGGTIEKFVLPKWIRGSQNNQKDKKFKWNSIWQGVFNDVKYIKELIICPRIEASEYQGFGYNSKFEVVRFLENVDRIHSEMFADTQIQELIFSDNQTDFDTEGEYYKGNAFSHANIGKLVKLGKITKIPAFFFASSNIGELRLPETVKEINYTAFQNATINKLVISKALYLNHKDALAQAKEIKTIEFIEGGSPTATPKLDALKTYISENTPTIVFKNVILTDAAPVASEIEKGKKGLKKSDAKLFEDAYNKAFNLTDEAQADAVLAEFKAAKTAVESAMVAGTKVATPNLDALKELIKNSSVDKLLAGVDQVDVPKAASELEKGKKQIAKSEVTKYEAALNTAKEVTEEDKALAAKQTLQNAIDTLKSKIVEGIKVSTPNLDALRELIKNSSVDKLLVGVDQVDTPKAASELEKGKKQIAKSEVTKYEAALAEANKVNDESKALAAKQTLQNAIDTLKSKIVEGIKVSTPNLDALRELIKNSSVDKLLVGVDQVDTPKAASELEKGKKQIAKSEVTKYEAALAEANKVNDESKALAAKQTLQNAIDTLKSKIVEGIKVSTPNLDALRELIKNSSVDTLLAGVEVLNIPNKPAADTIEKGKKVIRLSAKTTYESALNTAKAVNEESKALAAKQTLQNAIDALKAEIVTGTKEGLISTKDREDSDKFITEYMRNSGQVLTIKASGKDYFDYLNGEHPTLPKLVFKNNLTMGGQEINKIDILRFRKTTFIESIYIEMENVILGRLGPAYISSKSSLNLKKLVIMNPKATLTIEDNNLSYLNVDELVLPENITLGDGAFENSNIKKLVIKKSTYEANKLEFLKAKIDVVEFTDGGFGTPKLDRLKSILLENTIAKFKIKDGILDPETVTIKDALDDPSTYNKKTFQILKSEVDKYEAVWNELNKISDESKVQDAEFKKLEDAKAALEVARKEGTKKTNVDLLNEYLKTVRKYALISSGILKDVEIVDAASLDPTTYNKGTFKVLKKDVDEYEKAWKKAKSISDEDKAIQAKKDAENAYALLKTKIVEGQKV